jgi:hypothetical protein
VTQSGSYEVNVQPTAVRDANGNTNGSLLTLTVTK